MVAAASANMPKHEGGEGKWIHLPAECWGNRIKIKISQSRNPLHKGSRERKDYHCPIIIKQGRDVPHRQSDKRLQRQREISSSTHIARQIQSFSYRFSRETNTSTKVRRLTSHSSSDVDLEMEVSICVSSSNIYNWDLYKFFISLG